MSANPHSNGGNVRRELKLPDFRDYAVEVPTPATVETRNTLVLGSYLRDVMGRNPNNFRLFGPDETHSNRLHAVYEVTGKAWMADMLPEDEDGGHLSRDGRVMEMLSEHTLEGWLEGYLLTGRHGLFHTYEAFAHVIDSMFNQHAKWLYICKHDVPWRAPVSSLNILLSSVVWRQDHNGFSHQDPGFIDLVTNKSPDVTDVVMACCGDVPTMESLAATAILREEFPQLRVRFINVVDLFKLPTDDEHPHGLTNDDFDTLFTPDKPVIFNFHGYPWLIHKLIFKRTNQERFQVRGYIEEGNINTPLELAIRNGIDRFHLVVDVINRVPQLRSAAAYVKERMQNQIIESLNYAREHGVDRPEAVEWKWPY